MSLNDVWPLLLSPSAPEAGTTYFIKRDTFVRGGRSTDLEHLARVLRNTVHNREDFWVNLNPSSHNVGKGRSVDVTHWNHILLDIDPRDAGANPALSRTTVEAGLQKLGFSDCYTIIDSGRGIQIWLALTPLKLDDDLRPRVEYATAQFIRSLECGHGCVLDTSCSDLSRVARPPGSYNTKTGRIAQLLQVATRRSDPKGIMELAASFVQPVAPEPVTKISNLISVLAHLTETAATFICEGYREPGRHKACYATARNLKELGVDFEQAHAWIERGASLCSPRLSDFARVVKQVYERR